MTLGSARGGPMDTWLAPGTALCFSLMVAFLAPRYPGWFGAMPTLTRTYLAAYPWWIALSIATILLRAYARVINPGTRYADAAARFEAVFGLASVAMIAIGIIALAMPVLAPPAI